MISLKRKWWIGLAAVIVVAIVVAVAVWPGEREPEYQGKKLSEWLDGQPEHPQETAEAVLAIGTNGIPYFLRALRTSPARKSKAAIFLKRHGGSIGRTLAGPFDAEVVRMRAVGAMRGFAMLGPRAESAVRELTRIAEAPDSAEWAGYATMSLSFLGETAADPIAGLALSTGVPLERRLQAIVAMRNMTYLRTNGMFWCMSALARCGGDTNYAVRTESLVTLSVFMRPDGITNSLGSLYGISWTNVAPGSELRRWAMRAAIDFGTDRVVDLLISKGTNDPDPSVQAEVVRYLDRRKGYLDSQAKHER